MEEGDAPQPLDEQQQQHPTDDEAAIADARRTSSKPQSRLQRRDSVVEEGQLHEEARKHSDGKPPINSAYAEMNDDDHHHHDDGGGKRTTSAASNSASGRPPPIPPKSSVAPGDRATVSGQLPEEDLVYKPGGGHAPVSPSSRAPELPAEEGAATSTEEAAAAGGVLPRPARTPAGPIVGRGAELKEDKESSSLAACASTRTEAPEPTEEMHHPGDEKQQQQSSPPAATADPDLESPAREASSSSSTMKGAAAAAAAAPGSGSGPSSRKNSPPATATRTFCVKAEPLPDGERYWQSSHANPWKEGGVGTGNNNTSSAAAAAVPATQQPLFGRRSGHQTSPKQQQQQQPKVSPFPFDHLMMNNNGSSSSDPTKGLKGSVNISSTHRALPGKKRATMYRAERPEFDARLTSSARMQQKQQQEAESPLNNFVKIPQATRPAKIADRTRNTELRRHHPEVLHVGLNNNNNSSNGGAAAAQMADALESKAVALLVADDVGSPLRRGDAESGKLAVISPRDKREPFPSSGFRPINDGGDRKSTSVAASTQMSFSRKLLGGQQEGDDGGDNNRRFASIPSIPSKDRPVAQEIRNSEIVVYEGYDRGFAERRLERLAKVGKNTIATHDTASSRLYRQQNRPPEGFCSTEDAIVQLARQHDLKKHGGSGSPRQRSLGAQSSRDMRSMESLLGVAVGHRDLVVSSRNLARAAKPVVPRSIPPPDHLHKRQQLVGTGANNNNNNNNTNIHREMLATHSVYPPLVAQDGADSWLQQQGLGTLRRAQLELSDKHGEPLLLQDRSENNNNSTNTQLALVPQPRQQQQQLLVRNPDGVQSVMIPSALPGAPPRLIGYIAPDQNNNSSSSNLDASFSLTPRLSRFQRAKDVNYSHPTHLPSAPMDTPQRFGELMQQRLQLAMKSAVPLNVAVPPSPPASAA